jgi:SAM-dependent methyltransferase
VCAALRGCLAAAAYTQAVVAEMEGLLPGVFSNEARPIIRHYLARRGDAAGTLTRLFAYADALDEPAVLAILGHSLTGSLLEAGILARSPEGETGLYSPFQLRPFEDLWLLADNPTVGRDAVMPPAGTTAQLTRVMEPSLSVRVLDVGCGPGSLALTAAHRGAPFVVGTDVNPRAVAMARFNARLNSVANSEFLVGDLVDPVRGSRFGLAVAQPPFVIQPPDSALVTFLHGGPRGEEIAVRLIGALPDVLAPGGRGLVLMEALVRPDEPLHARLKPALKDAAVDLLVLTSPGPPAAVQVLAYATLEAHGGGQAYATVARRYLEHLDSLDGDGFHHALVVLRAQVESAPGRLAATLPVGAIGRGDSVALEHLLAGIDLAAIGEDRLMDMAVQTAPYVRWVEERRGPDTSLEPARMVRVGLCTFGADFPIDPRR